MTQVKERSNLESQVQTIKAELTQVQAAHKKSLNSATVRLHSLHSCCVVCVNKKSIQK
jgi:hypothetical protein